MLGVFPAGARSVQCGPRLWRPPEFIPMQKAQRENPVRHRTPGRLLHRPARRMVASFPAASWEVAKVWIQRLPRHLVLDPDFTRRRKSLRVIERYRRYVYRVRAVIVLVGQRRSTRCAKHPQNLRRRTKAAWATRSHSEGIGSKDNPCDGRCSAGESTGLAVTKAQRKRRARDSIANRSA